MTLLLVFKFRLVYSNKLQLISRHFFNLILLCCQFATMDLHEHFATKSEVTLQEAVCHRLSVAITRPLYNNFADCLNHYRFLS